MKNALPLNKKEFQQFIKDNADKFLTKTEAYNTVREALRDDIRIFGDDEMSENFLDELLAEDDDFGGKKQVTLDEALGKFMTVPHEAKKNYGLILTASGKAFGSFNTKVYTPEVIALKYSSVLGPSKIIEVVVRGRQTIAVTSQYCKLKDMDELELPTNPTNFNRQGSCSA